MSMDGLRDSTIQWYVEWLEKTSPHLTNDQRLEMATGFVDAQCKPKRADDEVTDDDITLLVEATERAQMRKQERLTGSQMEKILADPKPLPANAEVRIVKPILKRN